MAKILEGSAVGQMIADRQALMALIGYRSNRKYAQDVVQNANAQRNLPDGQTAGDLNYELISDTNAFKVQQLDNARDFGQMDSVKPLSDVIGGLSGELAEYSKQYPGLTKSLAGAEVAIKAMTAAAVVFAGIKFFTGGGFGGVKAPPTSGGSADGLGRAAGTVGRWAGRIAAPFMLYQATQDAPLVQVERGDGEARKRVQAGQYSDDLSRLKDSARAQPGLLDAWDEVKSWWSPPTSIGKGDMATAGAPSYLFPQQNQKPQPIQVTTKLELDGRTIAESVNEYNGNQAERGPTGMPQ